MTDDLLVRYAEADGATVAWSEVDAGPALVVTGWWCSHLALNWADPLFRDYVERLADHRTVFRYDRPGTGRVPAVPGCRPRRSRTSTRRTRGRRGCRGTRAVHAAGPLLRVRRCCASAARHPERVERSLCCAADTPRGADISPPAVRVTLIAAATPTGPQIPSAC